MFDSETCSCPSRPSGTGASLNLLSLEKIRCL
ncbi:MAG: hypothetical protein DRH20_09775 [Deltaproteobacteria bacterium]|nr:MAG: hypothetical protein DRH20_09775 [Deltaproteobacteria bacterium]